MPHCIVVFSTVSSQNENSQTFVNATIVRSTRASSLSRTISNRLFLEFPPTSVTEVQYLSGEGRSESITITIGSRRCAVSDC
jgi:hypothetical protein